MSQNAGLIRRVYQKVQAAKESNSSCLVVFDLDATLFDVSHRLHRVMQDFASSPQVQDQFPHLIEQIKEIRFGKSDWGISAALERHGLASIEGFYQSAHDYWYEKYFSNEYLDFDHPYEGAVDFVQKIWAAGAEVVYLTGRDIPRMGPGTLSILKKWNFPVEQERATLILKPEKGLNDARFKADWFLENSKNQYSNIYFFENEPVNLQMMIQDCPHVELIYFESGHSGKVEPPDGVPKIENYLGLIVEK